MNNIRSTNIIILKQLTIEKANINLKNQIYLIIAATQSWKKNLKIQKFQLISQIAKWAGRNSERLLIYQASKN